MDSNKITKKTLLNILTGGLLLIPVLWCISCEKSPLEVDDNQEQQEEHSFPHIQTSAESHDYGKISVGDSLEWTMTIRNTGEDTLTVNDVSSNEQDINVLSPSFPQEIEPDDSIVTSIQFAPTEQRSYNATVTISSNDPNEAQMEIELTGVGLDVIYVPDDFTTIGEAVDFASDGNTIIVRDGTYNENIEIDKSLTIQSENGPDSTEIKAANLNYDVFEVSAGTLTLSGLSITGSNSDGISVIYESSLDIYNSVIHDNGKLAIYYNSGNNLVVRSCIIKRNGGGIYYEASAAGDATVDSTIIINNGGSALSVKLDEGRSATITHNELRNNTGTGLSLSIEGSGNSATIHDNVIESSGNDGMNLSGLTTTLTNISISEAGDDGLYISSSDITLQAPCTITNSTSEGIYAYETNLTLQDIDITDNDGNGIDFQNGKALTVQGCTVKRNGGGIVYDYYDAASGDAIIHNNSIMNNSGDGLRVYLDIGRTAMIVNNELNNNAGSAFYCRFAEGGGNATIDNNIIEATSSGDNIITLYSLINSTITNNYITGSFYKLNFSNCSDDYLFLNDFYMTVDDFYIYNSTLTWNTPQDTTYTYQESENTQKLGNYWDAYTGNDVNSDGIGDSPLTFDSQSDEYPLIAPRDNYGFPE